MIRNISIVLVFALVISSVTFWFINSSLKYIMYAFEVTLILLFYLFFTEFHLKFPSSEKTKAKLNARFVISSGTTTCAAMLLILNVVGQTNNYFAVALGVVAFCFVPGWAILETTNSFAQFEASIEMVILPFLLSIPVSALLYFSYLVFPNIGKYLLLIVYLAISTLPLIKFGLRREKLHIEASPVNKFSTSILILIVAFFVFAVAITYPQMASVPGLDIVEHFSSARQLVFAPSTYQGNEILFHIQQAGFYLFSESSMSIFQTMMAFLSIFSILSFYLMSKVYLSDIDKRLASLATIFWGVFSGFGWLYFLGERLGNLGSSNYYSLLFDTNNHSYWDVGYGQGWIWLWYRPLTLGLTVFFSLMYLMREYRFGRKMFIVVFSLLFLALNFIHFSESIIFVFFLLVLSVLRPIKDLRTVEAGISCAIGTLASAALLVAYKNVVGISITAPDLNQLGFLFAVCVASALLGHYAKRPKIRFGSGLGLAIGVFSILYSWLLLSWLENSSSFSIASVAYVSGVPWQFYPVLLGISGLLAMLALAVISRRYSKHPVSIFIALLIFAIIFGRILTYININFGDTGYWERRIVVIAYAAASIVAPIAFMEIYNRIRTRSTVVIGIFMAVLVIIGATSTFLSLEMQTYSIQRNGLSKTDEGIAVSLNNLEPDKVLLAITNSSLSLARFSSASWLIDYYRYQLWPATSPELPLNVLCSMKKQTYFLLRDADLQMMNQSYSLGYLANHVVPMVRSNELGNSSVYELPEMAAPSAKSQTILVLPDYDTRLLYFAYDILSISGYNYSTALVDDILAISSAKTLIAPTENIAKQLLQFKQMLNLKFSELIILNLDGYSDLSSDYFSGPTMTLSIDPESRKNANIVSNGLTMDNVSTIAKPMEFNILTTPSRGNSLDLFNNTLDGWASSGMGVGNISSPDLSLDYENTESDNASVQIRVGLGEYAYWQIAKTLPDPIDASAYAFISFNWYGKGDGKNYVLQLNSEGSTNYWYSFRDNWIGLKRIVIPMNISDGQYDLNGIHFVKVTNGAASWNHVERIEIRNEASNPNSAGNFSLNYFGFEASKSANFSLLGEGQFENFGLLEYNGSSWVNLGEFTGEGTINVSNYSLSRGFDSNKLFGEGFHFNVTSTRYPDSSTLSISIELPPYLDSNDFDSVKLKLTPKILDANLTAFGTPYGSWQTPISLHGVSFHSHKNVTAWYESDLGKIPLAISDTTVDVKTVYINAYPLINNGSFYKGEFAVLGNILGNCTEHSLELAAGVAENPVQGNLVAFSKVGISGNATIQTETSPIVQKNGGYIMLKTGDQTFTNITKIVFETPSLTLSSENCSLAGGKGFYSYLHSKEMVVSTKESELGTVLITFNNGDLQVLNIAESSAIIMGTSITSLRQPTILAQGVTEFNNLYTYARLSKTLSILGYGATFNGETSFKIEYGDTFSVANGFAYDVVINRVQEKYGFDELGFLVQSVPLLIVTCFVYLGAKLSKRTSPLEKTDTKFKGE
jgi:hypothetical protein